MELFKLVNKTNKKTYPENFNAYTSDFHFDGRITKLYSIKASKTNSFSVDNIYEVSNGFIEELGDIKTDLECFRYFLDNTNRPTDIDVIRKYWSELLSYNACEGKAALLYMHHNNLINVLTQDELLRTAIGHCSAPCAEFLLKLFNVENAEIYIENVMSLTELDFVEAIGPHLSVKFIQSMDVEEITAKHRYADVRKYLNSLKIKAYASTQEHQVVIKTA